MDIVDITTHTIAYIVLAIIISSLCIKCQVGENMHEKRAISFKRNIHIKGKINEWLNLNIKYYFKRVEWKFLRYLIFFRDGNKIVNYLVKIVFNTYQGLKIFEWIIREILVFFLTVQTSGSHTQKIIM